MNDPQKPRRAPRPKPTGAPGARPPLQEPAKPGGDRIAKVLARAGVASRRDAEKLILEGKVSVNGKRIDSPALNVTARDKITVDGKPIGQPEAPRLWLYHKPSGLVTTTRDEKGRKTVFDALPDDMPRVVSIGRLDLNSEGLLLLTNDGGIKRRLELPSTGWVRKYRVRIKGAPLDTAFEPLRRGITVDGERFAPMAVTLDRQQGANAWLTLALREGRNREIRRAMESIGLVVNRLIRISYGPFQLGELAAGKVEEIKPRVLRDQLGLSASDESSTKPRPKPKRTRNTPDPGPRR
jgi:23S rRNA pseudouridine2605 synthase